MTCPAHQKIHHPTLRKAKTVHRGLYSNTGVPNASATLPTTNIQSVPLSLRLVEPRAGSERGHKPCRPREGTRSDIFTYLRTVDGTLPFDCHPQLQLDRHPKKISRPIPARPTGRSALDRTQLCELCLHRCVCPSPSPVPPPFANGKDKTRTADDDSMWNLTDKTNLLDLANNSTAEGGDLTNHNYPYPRLRTVRRQRS